MNGLVDMEPIRVFSDGSFVFYGHGRFDNWCIYLKKPGVSDPEPPLDADYFEDLLLLGKRFGYKEVYGDFVDVYNGVTSKYLDECDIGVIGEVVGRYPADFQLLADRTFTILWMAMVSEMNYPGTRLGKRIKRLGAYYLLIEGKTVKYSVNFMRGMKWYEIDAICRARGF